MSLVPPRGETTQTTHSSAEVRRAAATEYVKLNEIRNGRRKMEASVEEMGIKKHTRKKGSRLRWDAGVHRMNEERLTKSEWKSEEGGRMRRGRPTLRLRDVVKTDLEKVLVNK